MAHTQTVFQNVGNKALGYAQEAIDRIRVWRDVVNQFNGKSLEARNAIHTATGDALDSISDLCNIKIKLGFSDHRQWPSFESEHPDVALAVETIASSAKKAIRIAFACLKSREGPESWEEFDHLDEVVQELREVVDDPDAKWLTGSIPDLGRAIGLGNSRRSTKQFEKAIAGKSIEFRPAKDPVGKNRHQIRFKDDPSGDRYRETKSRLRELQTG